MMILLVNVFDAFSKFTFFLNTFRNVYQIYDGSSHTVKCR